MVSAVEEELLEVPPPWKRHVMPEGLGSGTRHAPAETLRIPKYDFVVGNRRLVPSRPVEVVVRWNEGYYVASSETLHVWAAGRSTQSAMQDFTEQVMHFYLHYRGTPDHLVTGLAAKLKTIYAENFHEE